MVGQEQGLPEIKFDVAELYREEVFTDRRAGTLRRMVPVTVDGSHDESRPVLYAGPKFDTRTQRGGSRRARSLISRPIKTFVARDPLTRSVHNAVRAIPQQI